MIQEICKDVFWAGVVDWGLRKFHGHELSTHRGSTYNSYIILDEKIAVVDTVWGPFTEEFLENVKSVVDPAKINYIIANHSEPDHSGALPRLMEIAKNAELVVSKRGLESFTGHYHRDWKMRAVGTGDKISLGKNDLVFIEAPMLHWPDSMFAYLTGKNVLMPNDAFGQHYATAFRFNDEVDRQELYEEALKYYANILTPFSKLVLKKIDEVLALKLPVEIIAPSHGVIWRKDPLQIVHNYKEWAEQKPEPRAVIIYDTMWQATRKMAEAIGDGISESGVENKIIHAAVTDRNDAIVEIFRSKAIVIGSPTLNNGLLPTIEPILADIRGLKFQNKIGGAFGSYGWSGECVKIIEEHFSKAGIPIISHGISCKWQPGAQDIQVCLEFGRKIGDAVRKGS